MDLAQRTGIGQTTISGWLLGRRRARLAAVERVAAVLGIPVSDLAAEVAPSSMEQALLHLPVEVPVYSGLPVHAGDGGVPMEYVYVPASTRRRPGQLLGLQVRGVRMVPAIEDGDVVVTDLDEPALDGDVVVVELEDGWELRRYWAKPGGGYRLECDNAEAELDVPFLVTGERPARVYVVIRVFRGRPRRRR